MHTHTHTHRERERERERETDSEWEKPCSHMSISTFRNPASFVSIAPPSLAGWSFDESAATSKKIKKNTKREWLNDCALKSVKFLPTPYKGFYALIHFKWWIRQVKGQRSNPTSTKISINTIGWKQRHIHKTVVVWCALIRIRRHGLHTTLKRMAVSQLTVTLVLWLAHVCICENVWVCGVCSMVGNSNKVQITSLIRKNNIHTCICMVNTTEHCLTDQQKN